MRGLDAITIAALVAHRIELEYDGKSGTWVLTPPMAAHADRLAPDGTLLCLAEARDLHARDDARSITEAHRLLFLVHLRGIELNSPAMTREAANVCLASHGRPTLQPKGGLS